MTSNLRNFCTNKFPKSIVIIVSALLFYFLILRAGWQFSNDFPSGTSPHSWSEMLTNYQGGFLKRSLLGEIAYRLHPWIPVKFFIPATLTVLYIFVASYAIFTVARRVTLAGLLFLASPAGLLFPIHDHAAFGRKDIVVLAAFVLSCIIARSRLSTTAAFCAIASAYFVVGFIIEIAWLYMPLAIMVLIVSRKPTLKWQLVAGLSLLIYAGAIYPIATAYNYQSDPSVGVLQSWNTFAPGISRNVFCCLGVSFEQVSSMSMNTYRAEGGRYTFSLLLSLIPILLMTMERRVPPVTATLGLIAAAVCSAIPIVLAADWGRYIYLMTFQWFIALTVTSTAKNEITNCQLVPALAIAAIYGLSWKMLHFGRGFVPGAIPQSLGF